MDIEVQERLRKSFAKGNPWTFEQLKDYFEAGIDDAVDLATRTFFGLRDLDGNPQILHVLAAIKDYKEGKAHVIKR